ncbi:MAG: cytosine permease [Thermaerobacter sp.]|nr:cytosine permease [Thermaerobacter sp.]
MSVTGTTGESSLQRIANEVETVGVLPIEDSQRRMKASQLFIVWAMASASATTPVLGLLLYKMGFANLMGAIVLAFLIGLVPAGLFSEMGREIPVTALIVARRTYGRVGALIFAIFFTFVNVGWFGLNTEVGGQILSAIFNMKGEFWFWFIGVLQIVLVLFGMKWLEYFYRYTSLLLVICYGALTIYLFTHYHVRVPQQSGPILWGPSLSLILTFSILSWTYKISTVSRFAVPSDQTRGKTRYFLAPSIGIMLSVLLMGAVGMLSQAATGNWNVAAFGSQIPVWGVVAAFGVALAVVHTNALNLYPSTIDLLVALNTVKKPARWEEPVATVVLGVLSTVLAIYGILDKISGFLDITGDLIFPFTFIMLVDWIWIQRKRTPVAEFYERPTTPAGWFVIPAVVAWAVGFALNFWGANFLPAFFYNTLPLPVVGSLVAAAVYWVIAPKAGKQAAGAIPAEPTA